MLGVWSKGVLSQEPASPQQLGHDFISALYDYSLQGAGSSLLGTLLVPKSTRQFPKIRGTEKCRPQIVGLSLQGHPQKGSPTHRPAEGPLLIKDPTTGCDFDGLLCFLLKGSLL